MRNKREFVNMEWLAEILKVSGVLPQDGELFSVHTVRDSGTVELWIGLPEESKTTWGIDAPSISLAR